MRKHFCSPGVVLAVSATLFVTSPSVRAQDEPVALSASEFHRLVYAGHVLTEMANKPELDAVCQTLLELHHRNPHAEPAALSNVLRQALERFRNDAPVHLRSTEARDEILAVYLETLQQIPTHTDFNPATLSLLNLLMGQPGRNPPTNVTPSALLHAGNQGFINAEDKLAQRQALVDDCARRALDNASFRQAMDLLISAESGIRFDDTSSQIIGNNPALSANPAMQTLLALSQSANAGRVEISLAEIDNLLINELQILRGMVETNRQVHLEVMRQQDDLMAYLADTNLVEAMALYETVQKEPQTDLIVASQASVHALSELMKTRDVTRSKYARALGNCQVAIADAAFNWRLHSKLQAINKWNSTLKFGKASRGLAAGGGLAGVTMALVAGFAFPSPEQIMLEEIAKVKQMIHDLGTEMHGRFDRVDRSLNAIQETLDDTLARVNAVQYDVQQVREGLLDVQLDLHRLERQLFTSFDEQQRHDLRIAINGALYYENFNPSPMSWETYSQFPDGPENTFYTYSTDLAYNSTSSPSSFAASDLTDGNLKEQFDSRPLNANLNYLRAVLYDRLGDPVFAPSPTPLANPQDWHVSAYAYLQMALENPLHFRSKGLRLDAPIVVGEALTDFFRSLTFADGGTSIRWNSHGTLLDNYGDKLANFVTEIGVAEQDYANVHLGGFPVANWRNWAAAAPRVTTAGTMVTPPPLYVQGVTAIAAGGYHSLSLKSDGTVVGWGDNTTGQTAIPPEATQVVAIAGGLHHSLALREDGQALGWGAGDSGTSGDPHFGQASVPDNATNITAISAGHYHSLGLQADGQVLAWGAGAAESLHSFPHYGQSAVPEDATNITAVAAGGYHSLALREDGSLLPWGLNNEGQLDIPESATNVIAIAAGHGHNLVLKEDGTLVAWGNNLFGSTDVPSAATDIVAVAAAGWHCLALREDGAVIAWGAGDWDADPDDSVSHGQAIVPVNLTNVTTVAAGRHHSLALKTDGTVVGWGVNASGQSAPPGSPPGAAVALAAGGLHSLALQPDGGVTGWGGRFYPYPVNIPGSVTNVVAIAAGGGERVEGFEEILGFGHSLALRADGKVVAWGDDFWRQLRLSATENHGFVAIAAGYCHSLALRADGRVVGWGNSESGQINIPASATNVVAIAAGGMESYGQLNPGEGDVTHPWGHSVALRADGTVVVWGNNLYNQRAFPTAENHGFVAIAAGGAHSLALRADGTVIGWGSNGRGQRAIPAAENHDLVAIAAGHYHSLALRADGTVVIWGDNHSGQRNIPAAENHDLVAIAAGRYHSLAMRADGTLIGWGSNHSRQLNVPAPLTRYESWPEFAKPADTSLTDVKKVAAGADFTLVLRAEGQVLAWGVNDAEACSLPTGLGAVVDIAAGERHAIALSADGAVVAWGENVYGQTNVPASALTGVEAVAAGRNHSLALRSDGTVVAWGSTHAGQTSVPDALDNVVAIAAGGQHSLALKHDGSVVAWGNTNAGTVPQEAQSDVVAIAAGEWHDLALLSTGEVVAWGGNALGQTDVPLEAQSEVVAIATFKHHSLALKQDGTVVTWGGNAYGQTNLPTGLSNVVALATGWRHNVFLATDDQAASSEDGDLEFVLAEVPASIGRDYLRAVTANTLAELNGMTGTLHTKAIELSGARALLQAVLELGLPHTLERDDVLRGFFYGTEALPDREVTKDLLSAEANRLATTPYVRPLIMEEVVWPRHNAFATRLNERLLDLQATGQPEIPRVVGHTLRLLNLLRSAWAATPPPALEISSEDGTPHLLLHGEPHTNYVLEHSDDLSVPAWLPTSILDLRDQKLITMPVGGRPQRFYRTVSPTP